MSDKRLANLIFNTLDCIERLGQPTTEEETRRYFNRYETIYTAMVERDQRTYG